MPEGHRIVDLRSRLSHRILPLPGGAGPAVWERNDEMRVLGIDSATRGCSVAVWIDGEIVAERAEVMERGQAERLTPMVAEVLAAAGLGVPDLDRIAVTVGPGAFTGLRIGLATARGLALAANLPLIGVTTFEAVLADLPPGERSGTPVLILVDSRRAEPFAQLFDARGGAVGEPTALDPGATVAGLPAGPLLVAGDGLPSARAAFEGRPQTRFSAGDGVPRAGRVAAIGAARDPGSAPEPLYLRPPDTSTPRARP